jgi:hypothetical protein
MSGAYVSQDIVATIYPSGLCRVTVRQPSISGKGAKSHTS